MTTHIMLDLETWGTTPGSDIRSIGACVFDPLTGFVGIPDNASIGAHSYFYIACDNPTDGIGSNNKFEANGYRRYPLTRDPRTVQWWNDQSEAAREAFTNPVDLREALVRFTSWLDQLCGPVIPRPVGGWDIRLWSHGAHFDGPILAAAYEAVGLPAPWHYRAPRDTRTLFDAAGIDDHSSFMSQHNHGTAHHALDDAIAQARAVCAAWAML